MKQAWIPDSASKASTRSYYWYFSSLLYYYLLCLHRQAPQPPVHHLCLPPICIISNSILQGALLQQWWCDGGNKGLRRHGVALSLPSSLALSWHHSKRFADKSSSEGGSEGAEAARMDFSGTQGELAMPMHSPYLGLHHEHEQRHHHHGSTNGRHTSPPEEEAAAAKNRHALAVVPVSSSTGVGGVVRYRECLKNHAAAIGGSATDGCGEFMPAGEDGSLDALRCSACGCHRNFHRKEPPSDGGGRPALHLHHHHPLTAAAGGPLSSLHHRGLLVATALPPAPTRMVMPLNAVHHHHPHAATSAESDDARGGGGGGVGPQHQPQPPPPARKRFRTKFTAEQKARMLGFAEEAGWRLQRLEDAAVQRFCQEVGVKRRVLKVWMHNNKHTLARRQPGEEDGVPPHPAEPAAAGAAAAPARVTTTSIDIDQQDASSLMTT